MNKKVIDLVRKYTKEHLDKNEPQVEFDVFCGMAMLYPWQCKVAALNHTT